MTMIIFSDRHRVTNVKRDNFEKALKDLMDQISFGSMPFLDSDLTEGIIKLIVQECHKICCPQDLDALVSGLSESTKLDIMEIFYDIFKLKKVDGSSM